MDNITIKLYKDGNDLIVVFKNASDDLLNVVKRVLEVQPAPIAVPDLDPPPEYTEDAPVDLTSLEPLTPAPVVRDFAEFVRLTSEMMRATYVDADVKRACKSFYDSHNKIMADIISTLDISRVKGFIINCYPISIDLSTSISNREYSTINDYVDDRPEDELRRIAETIGRAVVSFFEKAD